MKVVTIIGARPQFIKAAPVSALIRQKYCGRIREILVHTGQHYDRNMSDIFFRQMQIPNPKYHLGVGGGTHAFMTGRMMEKIELVLQKEKPDWVLVYGDTNSTLAGALAAVKLHIPVAHVEAGLRSHNPAMPEEINRVLTDRISCLLLCPTIAAVKNLKKEGYPFSVVGNEAQRIKNVGDVMFDSVQYYRGRAKELNTLDSLRLQEKSYGLCTVHRQENTDNPARLENILGALRQIAKQLPLIFPMHPRTKAKIQKLNNSDTLKGIALLEPISYLEMQRLQMSAKLILTDSGGMQKEAYFHRVPCITLREETEWVETVAMGWNQVVGANKKRIIRAALNFRLATLNQATIYGDGHAAKKIAALLWNLR